jgi:aldehyde:ferredoxin oxidoreductase
MVKIEDAVHLWNKNTFDTEDIIKKDHGREFQILSIGPAGENLVRYACIAHDKGRELGRCGGGAVMGSKKLKAIAVTGHRKTEIAEPKNSRTFEINQGIWNIGNNGNDKCYRNFADKKLERRTIRRF